MTLVKLFMMIGCLVAAGFQAASAENNPFIEPSHPSIELDDSIVDSFSNYVSMESDFYARNGRKVNDMLVFVSDDLISGSARINETLLTRRSVLLSMSTYLSENFLCSLKQNALLMNDCKRKAGAAPATMNGNYGRFNRPIRVVGRTVSPSIDFAQIRKLYNQIEEGYFRGFNVKREDKILHSVLIIAKTNLISMFKLLFRNFNVPVVALDVHSFTYRFKPGARSPVSVAVEKV
jgi:hypothetical protein